MNPRDTKKDQSHWQGIAYLMALAVGVMAIPLCSMSCAPKAIPVEPIAPKAAHLQASLASSATSAAKIANKVTGISAKTESLSMKTARAMLAADALRKSGLATREDLEANAAAWHEVHADIGPMLEAGKAAVVDARELERSTQRASGEAKELSAAAVKVDKVVVDQRVENAALTADAEMWRRIKFAGGSLLGLVILYFLVKAFKPSRLL